MKKHLFVFLMMLSLIVSLQAGSKPHHSVIIRFNAQPNDTFTYKINTESYSSQNYMNNLYETSIDTLLNIEFKVLDKNDTGTYTIEGKIKKIIYSFEGNNEHFLYKSENKDKNPTDKIFDQLLESNFTFKLTPEGDIKEVKGLNKKIEKIFELTPLPGDINPAELKKIVYAQFSNYAINHVIEYIFFMPEKPIKKGLKWKETKNENGNKLEIHYIVKSFKNNIVHIDATGKMELKKEKENKEKEANMSLSFTADINAGFDLNSKSGMVENAAFQTKQNGALIMNQHNTSVTIPMSNEETIKIQKI